MAAVREPVRLQSARRGPAHSRSDRLGYPLKDVPAASLAQPTSIASRAWYRARSASVSTGANETVHHRFTPTEASSQVSLSRCC